MTPETHGARSQALWSFVGGGRGAYKQQHNNNGSEGLKHYCVPSVGPCCLPSGVPLIVMAPLAHGRATEKQGVWQEGLAKILPPGRNREGDFVPGLMPNTKSSSAL